MTDSEAPIFFFDNADPEMQQAYEKARETFRYFWRELAWEHRRIIPALDVACVKAPFFDAEPAADDAEQPDAEQMWLSDVTFDGKQIEGTLINSPHWVTSVAEGDVVHLPINGITDWMYAINNRVYGAYTVNLMRARMGREELEQHDDAWGMDFGDPRAIEVCPANDDDEPLGPDADHPMAVNMGASLSEYLDQDPANIHLLDDQGWSLLHHQALAGSITCVSLLLERGADPNAKTNHGMTALELANSLQWGEVARILAASGAK